MIVVDANILAYLYLPRDHTHLAEALLENDPGWAAPILWRSEFRNILAGYIRRDGLTLSQACRIQLSAEDLMRANEYAVDSTEVLTLVGESECSAHECEYVALAVALGTRLVTRDEEVLRCFPRIAVALQ